MQKQQQQRQHQQQQQQRQQHPLQLNGNITTSQSRPRSFVYKLGIYGWRKRCLYFLILLIAIIAIVNLALIIWVIKVMDFGLHGMGRLRITRDGIRMDGVAEFMSTVRTKSLKSRNNEPIQINSRKKISLSAIDIKGNVVGQISLDSDKIILKNKKLHIQDKKGRTLLYVDDDEMKLDIDNMKITVPGGLNLENSVQTTLVESAGHSEGLTLESLNNNLFLKASEDVAINSYGGGVKLKSYQNMKFRAKNGQIVFDSKKVQFKNLPQSSPAGGNIGEVYDNIADICVCKDGTVFLAPPDVDLPCKVTDGVCPT